MKADAKAVAMDALTREFCSRLRERRKSAGLTQADLAKRVGVHVTTISNYESKGKNPSLGVLMRLAEVFGYDLSESVNTQYYKGELNVRKWMQAKSRYGFSDLELGRLTGYDAELVKRSLNLEANGTLPCLQAVIEVLEREKKVRG